MCGLVISSPPGNTYCIHISVLRYLNITAFFCPIAPCNTTRRTQTCTLRDMNPATS